MKSTKEIRYEHPHYGTVYVDGSFETIDGKEVTFGDMAGWRDRYRAADRMHKPLTLSFWTDVVNGKRSRWPLPEPEPEVPPHGCPDCANSWPVWCQECSDEMHRDGCSDCGEHIDPTSGRDTCPTCALAEYSRTGSRAPLQPKPKPEPECKPKVSQRMLRLARLLHLGALPLWDGWAYSRGHTDPVPEGARVYSPADGPEYAPAPVLEIFASRPRIRKVIGVYDAMVLRETSRGMTGVETALDYALALLESGEVSA